MMHPWVTSGKVFPVEVKSTKSILEDMSQSSDKEYRV